MSTDEFEDLSGRIDGLGKAVAALVADMEIREAINGPRFCNWARHHADELRCPPDYSPVRFAASLRTLRDIASLLDDARDVRNRSR